MKCRNSTIFKALSRLIIKLPVCEDEERDRRRLLTQLEAALNVMDRFDTADGLLTASESTFYWIFFLDILPPGLSGMNAAFKLRLSGTAN